MAPFDLVLVGGGHANLSVLADRVRKGSTYGARAALITPSRFLTYSGMVPGWIAGHYGLNRGQVDLLRLAERAETEFVLGRCSGIGPDGHTCLLEQGAPLPFRWASIDTGGSGQASNLLGEDPRLIDVRPMDDFVARLDQWRGAYPTGGKRVAVLGGGAGGVELAFAMRNMAGIAVPHKVQLVTGGGGLLPGFAPRLRRLALRELARQGVELETGDALLGDGRLMIAARSLEPVDLIIAALGSGAPGWPRASGLAVDAAGFIAVDEHQRSLSHPHILAAGDVASRRDRTVARAGVHAVHAGPVLAANLGALLAGQAPPRVYRPRPVSLYLMNCGNRTALASYGPLAAHARWCWHLKHLIDARWIAAYAQLAGV